MKKQKAELDFRASGKTRRYSWDYDERMDIFSAAPRVKNSSVSPMRWDTTRKARIRPTAVKLFLPIRDAYEREDFTDKEKVKLKYDIAYFGEIYIMNADGTEQKRLTFMPGYDGGPFFSPDGKRIIWRHFSEKET